MAFERILAVGAHPDDCEFYAGATLSAFAAAGVHVTLVICTDGAMGGREGGAPLAQRRRREAERAAKEMGVAELVRLGHPDGALRDDDALVAELVREIRRARPNLVLAHDPSMQWTRVGERYTLAHSDHGAAGRAVLAAVYPRAALPTFCPDQIEAGLRPWWVPELWLFDTNEPDYEPSVEATLARKLAALACHESQNEKGALVAAAERRAAGARARRRGGRGVPPPAADPGLAAGASHGPRGGAAVEAFRRLPLTPA